VELIISAETPPPLAGPSGGTHSNESLNDSMEVISIGTADMLKDAQVQGDGVMGKSDSSFISLDSPFQQKHDGHHLLSLHHRLLIPMFSNLSQQLIHRRLFQ